MNSDDLHHSIMNKSEHQTSAKEHQPQQHQHKQGSIRHIEKRRIGTCLFADRVARISVERYKQLIPCSSTSSSSSSNSETCLATIVAYFADEDKLQVMGMGIGTKFLSSAVLQQQQRDSNYGTCVRDCHAEVLARRAFHRQLYLELLYHMQEECKKEPLRNDYSLILNKIGENKFELDSGVTLHMYTSSAPCGNATLKKFTKMTKETFQSSYNDKSWPDPIHEPMAGTGIKQGQFLLLLKRDPAFPQENPPLKQNKNLPFTKWQAFQSDKWCPPGTTLPVHKKNSIHCCSDKICRWNCLGFQGSLLSYFIPSPLRVSSITVGRKFSNIICRRALCCRALPFEGLNHPAVMCTAVYMNENGVIDMSGERLTGQDVRFHSSLCWVWWPNCKNGENANLECLNGTTGHLEKKEGISQISTLSLLEMHHKLLNYVQKESLNIPFTLPELRKYKKYISTEYEAKKNELLSNHHVFKFWCRRESDS